MRVEEVHTKLGAPGMKATKLIATVGEISELRKRLTASDASVLHLAAKLKMGKSAIQHGSCRDIGGIRHFNY